MKTNSRTRIITGIFIILLSLTVYIITLCPTVPPYRDSGELISVINELGIAHPPGYPLYTIAGKVFTLIPVDSIAFRVNLMSAVFGALTALLIFLILLELGGKGKDKYPDFVECLSAAAASLIFSFSYTFWYLSVVSEMYTMDTFFIALLVLLLLRFNSYSSATGNDGSAIRYLYLFCFIAGIALTNRLTIILFFPALVYFIYSVPTKKRRIISFEKLLIMALFVMLGVSIYLYLPVRSLHNPSIDWGNPETLRMLIRSVTRKAYGHSLDRVAENYKLSEVILPQMWEYAKSMFDQFRTVGILLGMAGLWFLFKKEKKFFIFSLLLYFLSGPLFIILSKMPPNPHALAIMEPSYIPANLIFVLWVGFGIKSLVITALNYKPILSRVALTLALLFPCYLVSANFEDVDKSNNYLACDYAINILNSVDKEAIVFLRKDVQLFSVWYLQKIKKMRPDVIVIPQGLFLATWYMEQMREEWPQLVYPYYSAGMGKEAYTKAFIKANQSKRSIYVTVDFEAGKGFFSDFEKKPEGLLKRILPAGTETDEKTAVENLNNLYRYRGVYRTDAYKDFFSPALIRKYAIAHNELGLYYFNTNEHNKSKDSFTSAINLDPGYALANYNLGINYFSMQKYKESIASYLAAIKIYKKDMKNKLFVEYIKPELAKVYNNLGAAYEKLGNFNDAIKHYYMAIGLDSGFDEPHYNIGVLYWKQERWHEVIMAFEKALRINPNHQNARKFLYIARQKQKEAK